MFDDLLNFDVEIINSNEDKLKTNVRSNTNTTNKGKASQAFKPIECDQDTTKVKKSVHFKKPMSRMGSVRSKKLVAQNIDLEGEGTLSEEKEE